MSSFGDGKPLNVSLLDDPQRAIVHPPAVIPISAPVLDYQPAAATRPSKASKQKMGILRRSCFAAGLAILAYNIVMCTGRGDWAQGMALGAFLVGLSVPIGGN